VTRQRRSQIRIVERAHAADDADLAQAIADPPSAGGGVGAAARHAGHREPLQPEGVGQLDHVGRPAADGSAGLRIGQADARPVRRDQADAAPPGGPVGAARHPARARRAMKEQQRQAVPRAVLGVTEPPAVRQPQHLRRAVNRHRYPARVLSCLRWSRGNVPAMPSFIS